MKILLINNFYYNRGGDCTYLFSLKNLLEQKGHKVIIFSMHHPDNFESEYSKYFVSYINYDEEVKSKSIPSGLKVLRRTIYSFEARRKIENLIIAEKPDIAHLQNIHHHITPSIFSPLKKHNIPIIWTLHDFTVICPNTSFLSNGKVCEKCKKRKYFWPSIVKCKKNSFAASTMAAVEIIIHRLMRVNNMVDLFIAPSKFMQNKLVEYGFNKNKTIHLNNFNIIEMTDNNSAGEYYLYIGRISYEKGIKTLIDAAINVDSCKLKIVGDGALKEEMISYVESRGAANSIEFLGRKSHKEVIELLGNCKFVVLTSECYENFPYTLLEAGTCGKPAIASRIGGIPEIVKNYETGLLFEPGNSEYLELKIKFLVDHPDKAAKFGRKARTAIANEMSAETYYKELMTIYKQFLP